MAGFMPAIHVFLSGHAPSRECPGQVRAWRGWSFRSPLIPARQHRVYPMLAVQRAQVAYSRLAMGIQGNQQTPSLRPWTPA